MPEILTEPKPTAAAPTTTPPAESPPIATAAIPPAPGPVEPPSENPYAELDAAIKKLDTPAPTTKGKEPAPKPSEKPAAAPATPSPKGKEPPQLRAELERVKGELKTKESAFTALESKIAEYEAKGKDTTALTERLTALENQINAKDAEIRALKQEASPEFKKKYDEPFDRLANRAKTVIEKIQVEDANSGTVRTTTWGDFTKIYALDEFTATKESKAIFGEDGAQIAMGYYRQLHELDDSRRIALEEEKRQWKEKDAADQAKHIQTREEINKLWQQTNKELAEKIDDYHDSPEDKELSDARAKAYALFDAPVKNLKEKVIKDAHNRQRVAAFAVHKIIIARRDKELADLKAEIEGLKSKPPGPTKRAGGAPTAKPEEDFETGLRKHMQSAS